MRYNGTLAKWNDDRGFGFIAPIQGNQEIFVHISAFPRDGKRPRVGEPLSFEIETAGEGKKRAVGVLRPIPAGVLRHPLSGRRARPGPDRRLLRGAAILAVIGALAVFGYRGHSDLVKGYLFASNADFDRTGHLVHDENAASGYRCDGRTHCSQMTSCAEARFFLQNCPGVKMDGDRDGVPCEDQWCSGSFFR
ncbi:MAG: cold shock domain-containing protein [Chromatiaceae bacterium]|nr:cold shock domain-containing protein [Chromatiaceae bacterium]